MRTKSHAERKHRNSIALLAVAGILAVGGVLSIANDLKPDPVPETTEIITWHEDTLPDAMYQWVDLYGADLVPVDQWIDPADNVHFDCWHAVADTTLTMCPDGYVTTS